MLRRNVRLRKEYLYKKALEEKEREPLLVWGPARSDVAQGTTLEKKRKLREALEQNKSVPTELRGDTKLRTTLDLEDDRTKVLLTLARVSLHYLNIRTTCSLRRITYRTGNPL